MSSTFSKFISSAQNQVIKSLATIGIRETAQSRAKAQNVNNSKKNYLAICILVSITDAKHKQA